MEKRQLIRFSTNSPIVQNILDADEFACFAKSRSRWSLSVRIPFDWSMWVQRGSISVNSMRNECTRRICTLKSRLTKYAKEMKIDSQIGRRSHRPILSHLKLQIVNMHDLSLDTLATNRFIAPPPSLPKWYITRGRNKALGTIGNIALRWHLIFWDRQWMTVYVERSQSQTSAATAIPQLQQINEWMEQKTRSGLQSTLIMIREPGRVCVSRAHELQFSFFSFRLPVNKQK